MVKILSFFGANKAVLVVALLALTTAFGATYTRAYSNGFTDATNEYAAEKLAMIQDAQKLYASVEITSQSFTNELAAELNQHTDFIAKEKLKEQKYAKATDDFQCFDDDWVQLFNTDPRGKLPSHQGKSASGSGTKAGLEKRLEEPVGGSYSLEEERIISELT